MIQRIGDVHGAVSVDDAAMRPIQTSTGTLAKPFGIWTVRAGD